MYIYIYIYIYHCYYVWRAYVVVPEEALELVRGVLAEPGVGLERDAVIHVFVCCVNNKCAITYVMYCVMLCMFVYCVLITNHTHVL